MGLRVPPRLGAIVYIMMSPCSYMAPSNVAPHLEEVERAVREHRRRAAHRAERQREQHEPASNVRRCRILYGVSLCVLRESGTNLPAMRVSCFVMFCHEQPV